MKKLLLLPAVILVVSCSQPAADDHANHTDHSSSATTSSIDRLTSSPRHHEWVEVKRGDKTIHTFVVYPEASSKVPAVLLIHENRGLNDWARGLADQVAEAGYIAVAPDLLSDFSDQYSRTSDFPNEDAARNALSELKPADVTADLEAVAAWAKTIPSTNGKLASAGFCWGGGQSFTLATASDELDVAMVFYGTGPTDAAAYKNVSVPVHGFYGGDDARVNATIQTSEQNMTSAGKEFDAVIYEGADHAFMRIGEDPSADAANVAARNQAWARMKQILSDL